jgi:hypothetical protein
VPDKLTGVGIALHAMTFDEVDAFLGALAEAVLSIRSDFEYSTFECSYRVMAVVR